jgi:hypothetical protein
MRRARRCAPFELGKGSGYSGLGLTGCSALSILQDSHVRLAPGLACVCQGALGLTLLEVTPKHLEKVHRIGDVFKAGQHRILEH